MQSPLLSDGPPKDSGFSSSRLAIFAAGILAGGIAGFGAAKMSSGKGDATDLNFLAQGDGLLRAGPVRGETPGVTKPMVGFKDYSFA